MDVPSNDDRIKNRKCMDFIRSSSICGSDTTSVFFDKLQPREQINQLTAFIDGSQVCYLCFVCVYLYRKNRNVQTVCASVLRYTDLRMIVRLYYEKSTRDLV